MSPKKLLILTAIVAVLFGFIVLFERRMPSTSEIATKGELHWDIPVDRVEHITITRGPEKLEFQRADPTHWALVAPHKFPADAMAVSTVASDLAGLKRAGEDAPEARPGDYGLDKPVATATWVWTDPGDSKKRESRTVEFGSAVPGTDIVAARVAGSQKILFVPATVLANLKKNADDFQSKDLFGGSSADVSRIEILRGRGRLALARKSGSWWLSEPLSDLADSGEADRLLGQLTGLRAHEFVHGTVDLAERGLNPPLFRVSVTDAKGAAIVVDFGATLSDGNAVYAQREGQVLTVDREIVDDLSKEAVAFRSTRLVDFNRSDVTALEGSFGSASYALAQKDGGWSVGGHPILAAAADDLETAILGLKSSGFLDDGEAKALAPPVATLTVKTKTGAPWSVWVHPHAGGAAARVSSRPGGFRVDAATQSQLDAAFRKAVLPPATPDPVNGKR